MQVVSIFLSSGLFSSLQW